MKNAYWAHLRRRGTARRIPEGHPIRKTRNKEQAGATLLRNPVCSLEMQVEHGGQLSKLSHTFERERGVKKHSLG